MRNQVTEEGVDLIKSFEACKLKAYDDGVGVWTIGWGHTEGVKRGQAITQRQADRFFEDDLDEFAEGVADLIKTAINDNQFSACVSLAFNIGLRAFGRSTLLRKLNARDFTGAAAQFLAWNKGGGKVMRGLTRRREAERKLFLKPVVLSDSEDESQIPNGDSGHSSPASESVSATTEAPAQQTVEASGTGTQVVVASDTKPVVSEDPGAKVFELAKTGFGTVSKGLTGGSISMGFVAATVAFLQNNWVAILAGMALAMFLIACGVGIFLFAQHQATKKKLKEADIRSNPQLFNVKV